MFPVFVLNDVYLRDYFITKNIIVKREKYKV